MATRFPPTPEPATDNSLSDRRKSRLPVSDARPETGADRPIGGSRTETRISEDSPLGSDRSASAAFGFAIPPAGSRRPTYDIGPGGGFANEM